MKITDDIFKSQYLQWKCLNFNYNMYNFTEVYSQGSNWLQVSTGSGSGLAPNSRETITRINADPIHRRIYTALGGNKQRFLTPGHQGWNDLHSLCRIGMEYYLLNNDDNNIIYWIMMIIMIMMTMIIIMIIMMTMMIIGTATIMIMIIIITTTLTMTIMKMIMIKTAQTPCQSLHKDRRI